VSGGATIGLDADHLIHIGYPKAGSTFLQESFASHPELAYRKGAIAGFAGYRGEGTEPPRPESEPLYAPYRAEYLLDE
jgi:hypothetical protein